MCVGAWVHCASPCRKQYFLLRCVIFFHGVSECLCFVLDSGRFAPSRVIRTSIAAPTRREAISVARPSASMRRHRYCMAHTLCHAAAIVDASDGSSRATHDCFDDKQTASRRSRAPYVDGYCMAHTLCHAAALVDVSDARLFVTRVCLASRFWAASCRIGRTRHRPGSSEQALRPPRDEKRSPSRGRLPPCVDTGTVWRILCVMRRPSSTHLMAAAARRMIASTTSKQRHEEVGLHTSTGTVWRILCVMRRP